MPHSLSRIFLSVVVCSILASAQSSFSPRDLDYQVYRGRWDEALSKIKGSGNSPANQSRPADTRSLVQIAEVLVDRNTYHQRDMAATDDASRKALDAAEQLGQPELLAHALHTRARFFYWQAFDNKDWNTPQGLFLRAQSLFEKANDLRGQSFSWFYLGLIEQMQERFDAADERFRKGLALAKPLHDPVLESFFHRHLGASAQEGKRWKEAEAEYKKSLELREEGQACVLIPFARITLAEFYRDTKTSSGKVVPLLEQAARTADECGSTRAATAAHEDLAKALPAFAQKKEHAEKALQAAQRFGDPQDIKEAEELLRSLKPN